MRVAILGAMLEEVEYFKNGSYKELKITKTTNHANRNFYEGTYKDIEVVIAHSEIGKVNSTITTTLLLEKFKADMLIFTGVAGGINSTFKIGDLMVANKLTQHDVDLSPFGHPYGFIPAGKVFVESSQKLVDLAKSVAATLHVELKEGVVATGDQFVASVERTKWIKDTFSADAVEMEGASVAFTCEAFGVPFVVIRAISDGADEEADISFDEFLAHSAKVSSNFVINMLEELNNDRD